MKTPIKLSPSDLTFLWDECKRCFYLKYVHGIMRPSAPFPSIFGVIDRLMKEFYQGRSTTELDADLPTGTIRFTEKWVESMPISIPGHTMQCYVKGKFDTVVAFDNGSYGVVDFKTSEPKASHIPFYSRQLHAYAYALEHPASEKFALKPISKLGLLIVAPNSMEVTSSGLVAYLGSANWKEIPRDESSFLLFLAEVMTLVEQSELPVASATCAYCQYREHARQHGM